MQASGAYTHATVLPMTRPEATAQAVCWHDGVIVAVGSNKDVEKRAKQLGIKPEPLNGKLVLPGFVDAHMHFLHAGILSTRPDLRGCKHKKELFKRIKQWIDAHPTEETVIAEGFDEAEWEGDKRIPTREELDQLSDKPLVARRMCGHVAVANSAALALVQERFTDPDEVKPDTGLLLESPSLYLNDALPSSAAQLDAALEAACVAAHKLGVTAVGGYEQAPARAAMQRAAAAGTLTVRLSSNIYVQQLQDELVRGFRTGRRALGPGEAEREHWVPASAPCRDANGGTPEEPVPGHDAPVGEGTSAWLTDGGMKVFLDGSLGGHTAYLREPYHDKPGTRGKQNWRDEELDAWFGRAHHKGIQIHAHVIGDGAVEQGLQAYSRLRDSTQEPDGSHRPGTAPWEPSQVRHRFEHYEIVDDELLEQTIELGIVPCSQPNFVGVWSAKGGMYEDRLGRRFGQNNRFATFHKRKLAFCFGSDGMPFGPLYGIQAALQHPDPKQRISPELAIWYYTKMAAWAIHREDLGALARGKRADIVVLDTTTLEGDATQWGIHQTITGGVERL